VPAGPQRRHLETDLKAHGVACPSVEGQTGRTRLHTEMEVVSRSVLRELDPQLVVTGSKEAHPELRTQSQRSTPTGSADAFVYDTATN
jgi:hypothetical protein